MLLMLLSLRLLGRDALMICRPFGTFLADGVQGGGVVAFVVPGLGRRCTILSPPFVSVPCPRCRKWDVDEDLRLQYGCNLEKAKRTR